MKPEGQDQEENIPENSTRQLFLQASEGLLYPSESDYPFTYIEWNPDSTGETEVGEAVDLSKEDMLQLANKPADSTVKALSLDDFFKNVTQVQDWYEAEEIANVERFVQLKDTLQEHLSGIQVFKVGEIEIDAFIVGKTADNKWAGLATTLIET
jgi:alpha-D-ribose 1-methylphosphonate 5-phosphate C-P lyase